MIKKHLFFILLTISIGLMSFQLSKGIQKKVHKEINAAFDIKEFDLKEVYIPLNINYSIRFI